VAPRRSRLRRILVGLLVLFLAGEVGARLWDLAQGPTGSLYDFIVPSGTRFKLRPSTTVLVPERYGDITYHFNRQGYRDIDHDPQARRRRLVWLGDSVSFGLGVEQDQTFVGLLQQKLAAGSPPLDLVNLAIFAYHTGNELDALREEGLPLRPELVVVQFYMNDFATPGTDAAGTPAPAPPPGLLDRLTALKNRYFYKLAFVRRVRQISGRAGYALVHDLRRRFPDTLNDDQPRGALELLQAQPDDRSIAAFQALRAIREATERSGARLFVFISPDEVQLFTERFDGVNERFARFCAAEGLDCFDPLPQLRAAPDRAELFYDGVHYAPPGHARLAGLLLAALEQRGLLAPAAAEREAGREAGREERP
jgi:lysophospholipase L1-like esterase